MDDGTVMAQSAGEGLVETEHVEAWRRLLGVCPIEEWRNVISARQEGQVTVVSEATSEAPTMVSGRIEVGR